MSRIAVLIILFTGSLFAQEAGGATPTIHIPKVERAPKMADFLNGTPREAECVVADFRQMDPGDGTPVSQPTTAFLSYDDKNLYVAFIAKDDPKLIRARVAKRKQILTDDRITINIDTFHDHLHAYWFDVNPYAIQFDGITTDGYGDDFSWEGLWHTEGKIVSDGYVVFITIPFKTLRFPDAESQTWGVVLGRFINRNNEFSMWPFVTRRKLPQFVGQFGHMEGLQGISPGRNLYFTPYGLLSKSRYLDQTVAGPPVMARSTDPRAGLDAKMVIKDALTLDMTLNPDFSQVESDEPQVTVNQRFEVVYPEKRPFFMENASYFNTPQNLFFSRRIVDPEYGIRLTGKLGRWGIGVLAADDRAPGKSVSAADPLHGKRATDAVLSLQRDLFHDSHVRLFVTDREFSSGYNRIAALDTRLHFSSKWFLTAQGATSQTRLLNGDQQSGSTYYAKLNRQDRKLQYYTTYTDRSPGFRAELGYIPRVDIREVKSRIGYKWWREKGVLVNFGPALIVLGNWNRRGQTQDWEADLEWSMEFKRLTSLIATRGESMELYMGRAFRKSSNFVEFKTEWLKWLAWSSSYTRGAGVNYYPASGLAPELGDSQNATAELTLRPVNRLRLDETYIYSQLKTRTGWSGSTGLVSVYNNHIVRSKLNYQFTREFSFRAIVDYNTVLPNTSLVSLEPARRAGYDLLFTYLLHPGTAIYAGYTDIYQNLALDPSRPPYLQYTNYPDFNTGRQAFVKLSYQFRF